MTAYPEIDRVRFEGRDSDNALAFHRYDPDKVVAGRSMREHLRFASCYWHTMRNGLADPFGVGTAKMPWDYGSGSLDNAVRRVGVFFEFLEKCRIDHYCFHDRDVAPEGSGVDESERHLDAG